jgi:dihydroceramidase
MLKRVDNRQAKKDMIWTIFIGVTTFLTGFGLWAVDNEFCDALRHVRGRIGLPWAFFLGRIFSRCRS